MTFSSYFQISKIEYSPHLSLNVSIRSQYTEGGRRSTKDNSSSSRRKRITVKLAAQYASEVDSLIKTLLGPIALVSQSI
jgi:hypothetical protein